MVTHFRNLLSHRLAVLSLYRCLLRHASVEGALLKPIRHQFKKQKSMMSPNKVRNLLLKGYEVDEMFRRGDLESIEPLLMELEPTKVIKPQLRNIHGQQMKRDLNNQQDPHTQKLTNHVNRYIRDQQRQQLLPRTIDPLIRATLLTDEAIHARAQLDIERAQRRVSRGAYRVHITNSNGVGFVRGPWRQSDKISPHILGLVKYEQSFFDFTHYWDQNRWLYESEDRWEKLIGGKGGWVDSMKSSVSHMSSKLSERKKLAKQYEREKLPSIVEKQQQISDRIHQRMKTRLDKLEKDIDGVTAHEDVLGKPTLRQLVDKYEFSSV